MRSVSGTQGSSGGLAPIGGTAGAASAASAASGASGFGAVLGASVAGNPGAGDRPGTGDQEHAGDHKDNGAGSDQSDSAAASLAALLGSIPAKAGVAAAPSTDAAPAAASDGETAPAAANGKHAHPGDGKKSIGDSDSAAQTGTLTGAMLVAAPATTAPASPNKMAGDTAVPAGQADDDRAGGVDAASAISLAAAAPASSGLPMDAGAVGDTEPANGLHVAAQTRQLAAQAAVSSSDQANRETDAITARTVADMAAPSTGSGQKIAQPTPVAASPHAAKSGAAKTSAENALQTTGTPATDQDTQQTTASAPTVVSIAGLTSAPQRDPAGTGDLSKLPGAPSSIDTNNVNAGAINQPSLATPAPVPDSHVSAAGSTAAPELIGADGAPQPMAGAVTTQVLSMIANGHDQVTLHVSPPALGDLTLRVDVQANNVSTWFGAAQPQVQQAVSDALAQLQTSLSGAGFNLVGAWVGADASAGRGQQPIPQPLRRMAGIDALSGVDAPATRSGDTDSSRVSVYV